MNITSQPAERRIGRYRVPGRVMNVPLDRIVELQESDRVVDQHCTTTPQAVGTEVVLRAVRGGLSLVTPDADFLVSTCGGRHTVLSGVFVVDQLCEEALTYLRLFSDRIRLVSCDGPQLVRAVLTNRDLLDWMYVHTSTRPREALGSLLHRAIGCGVCREETVNNWVLAEQPFNFADINKLRRTWNELFGRTFFELLTAAVLSNDDLSERLPRLERYICSGAVDVQKVAAGIADMGLPPYLLGAERRDRS